MKTSWDKLIGKKIINVKYKYDKLYIETENNMYKMYHKQDCCESVELIEGLDELTNVIGATIYEAVESTNSDEERMNKWDESYTWTYYKLSTSKGYVTLRWYGSSNGYYSESVDFEEIK